MIKHWVQALSNNTILVWEKRSRFCIGLAPKCKKPFAWANSTLHPCDLVLTQDVYWHKLRMLNSWVIIVWDRELWVSAPSRYYCWVHHETLMACVLSCSCHDTSTLNKPLLVPKHTMARYELCSCRKPENFRALFPRRSPGWNCESQSLPNKTMAKPT